MKQILRIAFVIALSSIVLTACKKDKSSPKNYLKVDNVTKTLSQGTIEYYSTVVDVHYLGLNLMTSGIGFDVDGYWTGSGTGLYFSITSTSSGIIPTGTYNLYTGGAPYPAFTWDYADYCMAWTTDYGSNVWVEIVSGTLEITKDGDKYTINFTGVDELGADVEIKYSGTLTWWDWSKKSTTEFERRGRTK